MHSPDRTQPLAHLRAASLPSPRRRMSTTPASTARGSASATPAASVIGQTSKHLPHWVQASAIALIRSDNADSNVSVGWFIRLILEPFQGTLSRFSRYCRGPKSAIRRTLANEGLDRLEGFE